MSRTAMIVTWVVMGLTLTGSIHYYIWTRLVSDPKLPLAGHRVLTICVVALALSIPLTFFFSRGTPTEAKKAVLMVGYVWMGSVLLTFFALLAVDVARGFGLLAQIFARDVPPPDPERRVTLARLVAGGVAMLVGTATAAGVREGLGTVAVREVNVRLRRLPAELDGTTIVQLSDVHVGPTIGRAFVEQIVAQTNALEPDIVAITGDLVDGSVRRLRELVAPLGKLKARHGVFFVTGNHEYYSGAESWCRELTRLGIRVLRNERVSVGNDSATFDLAGIDDYHASRFGRGHGADLKKAIEGRDPSRELVLLAHQPRAIFEAERLGVGLQLSGHTHGGQIWPWNFLVRLQQPVVSGLERVGESQIYVSNGTGYWGPPMRLAAPAEITKLTLGSGRA